MEHEAGCMVGGLPRHNTSGRPLQLLQGDHAAFLDWYKHGEDPDPWFLSGEMEAARAIGCDCLDPLQGAAELGG